MLGSRQQATNRGFLWRVRCNGRDSYPYGTIHARRPEWFAPEFPRMIGPSGHTWSMRLCHGPCLTVAPMCSKRLSGSTPTH
jgi:hypothetical protein